MELFNILSAKKYKKQKLFVFIHCLQVWLENVLHQSVVVIINVGQTVDVVDAADMRRRHGSKGPRRLQVVAVIQGRRRRTGPVGET